jgi:hypothetical protein
VDLSVQHSGAARRANARRLLGAPHTEEAKSLSNDANSHPASGEELKAALAEVEAAHPGWRCWPGVIPPLLYARRPNSSPPMVVRASTPQALSEVIGAAKTVRAGGAR